MTKAVVILSGGLDSTILLYTVVNNLGAENVFTLTYNYGQKQYSEIECAKKSCEYLGVSHKVLDIKMLGDIVKPVTSNIVGSDIAVPNIKEVLGHPQPVTYVPFRNMILISFAFSFAESVGATEIYSGLQATDQYGYWDTTSQFVENMNAVASLNRKTQIKLLAPFSKMTKADELSLLNTLDNLEKPVRLDYTRTCYEEGEISCGKCPSCAERIAAFKKSGMKDPIKYAVDINW